MAHSHPESQLLSFLRDCSRSSLGDYLLSRLNRDAHLRKELHALMDSVIENMAMVHLANFLRDHRAEIVQMWQPAIAADPPPLPAPPQKAVPGERFRSRRAGAQPGDPGRRA